MTGKPNLLVLLGPTAVGKTALSIELAKALGTEIISGDSMLIYRGFDIGAAKPGVEERQGIVHHLVDIREPWESYSAQEFQQEADACIRDMAARGKLPFLVGGTGLYVQSLVEGYVFNETGSDPAYRAELLRMVETEGGAAVYDLLCRTDPEAAKTIHPNNVRRVIRALEVAHLGGESISREKGEPPYDAFVAGLTRPRPELYDRINERCGRCGRTASLAKYAACSPAASRAGCRPCRASGTRRRRRSSRGTARSRRPSRPSRRRRAISRNAS